MITNACRLAILGAAFLAGCAGTQPAAVKPTLVLADYIEDTPQNAACVALGERARERSRQHAFKLVGHDMQVASRPATATGRPNPDAVQVPLGSHPAERMARQPDGTFHSLFVNCETRQAYIAKRGGVIDISYWFGPFDL